MRARRTRTSRLGTGRPPAARAALVALLCASTTAMAPVAAAQARSSRPTPRVPRADAPAKYLRWRPHSIVYSEDGASLFAGTGRIHAHMRWTMWNQRQARGRGADWHDDCTPSCAGGTYHSYPATVHLYRPRRLGGHRVFTRMTIAYTTARRPPYPAYRDGAMTYSVGYSTKYGTSYFWH